MKFTHHPPDGFVYDPARGYEQTAGLKPRGLWLSVDDDWHRWVDDEGLGWITDTWVVTLNPAAPILRLTDAEAIDKFTANHRVEPPYRGGSHPHRGRYEYIDWPTVAAYHAGIIIAPYCWERRLTDHTWWYYGWDCASGCIWDLTAIGNVEHAP